MHTNNKYEDTLMLSEWDVLLDTLDTDWLRSLSLCTYSSSDSESDVRGGTPSCKKNMTLYWYYMADSSAALHHKYKK